MFEIQYKTEFDKTFVQIETDADNYKRKMILQNQIPGLLPCKLIYDGQMPSLCYEVTGRKSLLKKYAHENIEFEEMELLFTQLIEVIRKSREYLLESKNFCLEPKNIYFDIDTEELFLLYHPNYTYERGKQYREFAEFLLDKVNHKDEHAVKIAYQFYKLSKEDFFSLESFQGFIEKERMMHEKKRLPVVKEEPVFMPVEEEIVEEKKKRRNIFTYFKSKKERKQEEEIRIAEETTLDDYFGDEVDCETVFFDTDFILKWSEKGFSKEYTLSTFPITVGKLKGGVQLAISDDSISRMHAKLIREKGDVFLQDLDSTNGTFINGVKVLSGQKVLIHRDDEIQFGKITVNVV